MAVAAAIFKVRYFARWLSFLLSVDARLDALPEEYLAGAVKSPTLLIIGEVVGLNRTLDWFDAPSARAILWVARRVSACMLLR